MSSHEIENRNNIATDRLTFETRSVNSLRSDSNRFQSGKRKDSRTKVSEKHFILRSCITNTAFGSLWY